MTLVAVRSPAEREAAFKADPLGEAMRIGALRALATSRERIVKRIEKSQFDSEFRDSNGKVLYSSKSMRADGELAVRALSQIDEVIADVMTMKLD